MDRKEFERLKEEEKEHLRAIKKLKGQLREAERVARMHRAVGEVTNSLDTTEIDARIEELERKAIEAEARLDVALESSGMQDASEPVLSPEEERKLKAEALVAQMKASLDPGAARSPEGEPEATAARRTKEEGKEETPPLPAKTIGRRPAETEDSSDEKVPEKTIGRVSPRRREGPSE